MPIVKSPLSVSLPIKPDSINAAQIKKLATFNATPLTANVGPDYISACMRYAAKLHPEDLPDYAIDR